ncbi:MAG: hypothetical protein U9O98_05795 [Asgard group archaeon]|nr:hypothetical protein [Asgard group archaeon]
MTKITLRNILNSLTIRMLEGRLVKEQLALKSLHYNLRIVGWDSFTLFPDGHAANATFLYLLFKIYHLIKPVNLLELGSGQSTLLTSKYIEEQEKAKAIVLEHNKKWYELFKNRLVSSNRFEYVYSPLESIKIGKGNYLWYNTKIFEKQEVKFNLIIIDGPVGVRRNSRIGILKYIPQILDQNKFIILLDDTERRGEKDTIKKIKKTLKKHSINYSVFHRYGIKKQTCICSPNLDYMEHI